MITEPALARPSQRSGLSVALVVHDLQDYPGHSLYTKVLANELSRTHNVSVFANGCDRPGDAQWEAHHVRAWRASALACVQTFPLGMRAHASALSNFHIQHSQGYCGGHPNVVTAHICVAAYLASLRDASWRNRLSLQWMAAAEERFYRRYQGRVIAVSGKVARELQEFYDFDRPISVIPHGVNLARFNGGNRDRYRETTRRQLGIDQDHTMALYVGDLTKAHAYLKELAAAALDVRLVIVTASRAYHWKAPNVQILPPTPALEAYYAAADAFVFPTTYDSFGMVVMEAMAAGLPIFSSDQAGVADLIESGTDGFVSPLDEWVEATAQQIQNGELLTQVGLAGKRTAAKHDWQAVVSSVEQVYAEVVSA